MCYPLPSPDTYLTLSPLQTLILPSPLSRHLSGPLPSPDTCLTFSPLQTLLSPSPLSGHLSYPPPLQTLVLPSPLSRHLSHPLPSPDTRLTLSPRQINKLEDNREQRYRRKVSYLVPPYRTTGADMPAIRRRVRRRSRQEDVARRQAAWFGRLVEIRDGLGAAEVTVGVGWSIGDGGGAEIVRGW